MAPFLSVGLSVASSCDKDWCTVSPWTEKASKLQTISSLTLEQCQKKCLYTSNCILGTHNDSGDGTCDLYGASSKDVTFQTAFVSVQNRDPLSLPASLGDSQSYELKQVGVATSLADCKVEFLDAYKRGLVDTQFGRFVVNPDGKHVELNKTFSLATPMGGKGPVKVIAKYNGNPNTTLTTGLGDPQAGACGGYYLVNDASSSQDVAGKAYLVDSAKAISDGLHYLWEFGGDGIRSSESDYGLPVVCMASNRDQPQGNKEFHTGTWPHTLPESPCASTTDTPTTSQKWTVSFNGKAWEGVKFGMGLCTKDTADSGYVNLVKLNQRHPECLDTECGEWEFITPPTLSEPAEEDAGVCYGFKIVPPPPVPPTPPTPTPPPSPPPSTCDFCHSANLECCGDGGIHTFCYDPKYNTCCDSPFPSGIDDPVKIVCAKDQQCREGCLPYAYDVVEEQSSHPTTEFSTELSLESDRHLCPGKSPLVFAECLPPTTCCGAHTFTPECYEEEYNECCHPEGSDFSVVCAKGQGCASTPNGVPFCVDEFEACRFCQDKYKPGFNTYLCHVYGADSCFHAPEPVSCKAVGGDSATFCFGTLGAPVVTANETLEFI